MDITAAGFILSGLFFVSFVIAKVAGYLSVQLDDLIGILRASHDTSRMLAYGNCGTGMNVSWPPLYRESAQCPHCEHMHSSAELRTLSEFSETPSDANPVHD